jgi:fructoselysine-6-P-deglycase FrlB-like protein
MNTGIKLLPEEKARAAELKERMANAPVMTIGSGSPTFAETAARDFYAHLQSLAVKHGLPDGSFYYGLTEDGEFTVPAAFVEEFDQMRAGPTQG